MPVTKAQKEVPPLDLPMVPFVLGGMGIWVVLALLCQIFRSTLEAQGRGDWLTICVAGFVVAIPGLFLMIVHDINRSRRRQSIPPQSTPRQSTPRQG